MSPTTVILSPKAKNLDAKRTFGGARFVQEMPFRVDVKRPCTRERIAFEGPLRGEILRCGFRMTAWRARMALTESNNRFHPRWLDP